MIILQCVKYCIEWDLLLQKKEIKQAKITFKKEISFLISGQH